MHLDTKPRVLLLAEAANPKLTSVSLIGWAGACAFREVADVHLVSELRNADDIRAGGWTAKSFTAIDNRKFQGAAFHIAKVLRGGNQLGWTIYSALGNAAYPVFERKVWKAFKSRLQAGEFDVVHRLTPLSPTSTSVLAGRCRDIGVPFLVGPLNGGLKWPKGFGVVRRREREWLSYLRGAYKLVPGSKATYRHAAGVIVGSRHTRADLPEWVGEKAVYIPENGLDEARFPRTEIAPRTDPLCLVFTGRLVPYKGADLLLEAAMPFLKSGAIRIDILGEGPLEEILTRMVSDAGVGDAVTLHGWVDHAQVHAHLRQAHVFAFPSVREFGGGVVIEAMAAGLLPMVVDYGGPAELVPKGCGITIPIGTREELVTRFRDAIGGLVEGRDDIDSARQRAQDFVYRKLTWSAKAQQFRSVYNWLSNGADRPDFGMPFMEH